VTVIAPNIWTAVSVKPNQAAKAEANLKQQGFNCLAPKIKVTQRQHNRFINATKLFFPGYIFVQIKLVTDDAWKVKSTYGVSNLLSVGNEIGVIPDDFIGALIDNELNLQPVHDRDLMPGQKVEITKGPFTGLVAELIQVDAAHRIRCLFDLMSGKITATLSKDELVVVG
jgi:transcriptional antiterminator RfaH